jgi:hypothetical protein
MRGGCRAKAAAGSADLGEARTPRPPGANRLPDSHPRMQSPAPPRSARLSWRRRSGKAERRRGLVGRSLPHQEEMTFNEGGEAAGAWSQAHPAGRTAPCARGRRVESCQQPGGSGRGTCRRRAGIQGRAPSTTICTTGRDNRSKRRWKFRGRLPGTVARSTRGTA